MNSDVVNDALAALANVNIRHAGSGDSLSIIRLISEVWAEYGCVLDAEVEETCLLTPDTYFRARGGKFWVAEDEWQIIATVAFMMLDPAVAELRSLYVKREYRGLGLGQRLTTMAVDLARARQAREIVLWSDTRFTLAHRLYDRMGFERNGLRRLDDLNNSTEFRFRYRLG